MITPFPSLWLRLPLLVFSITPATRKSIERVTIHIILSPLISTWVGSLSLTALLTQSTWSRPYSLWAEQAMRLSEFELGFGGLVLLHA